MSGHDAPAIRGMQPCSFHVKPYDGTQYDVKPSIKIVQYPLSRPHEEKIYRHRMDASRSGSRFDCRLEYPENHILKQRVQIVAQAEPRRQTLESTYARMKIREDVLKEIEEEKRVLEGQRPPLQDLLRWLYGRLKGLLPRGIGTETLGTQLHEAEQECGAVQNGARQWPNKQALLLVEPDDDTFISITDMLFLISRLGSALYPYSSALLFNLSRIQALVAVIRQYENPQQNTIAVLFQVIYLFATGLYLCAYLSGLLVYAPRYLAFFLVAIVVLYLVLPSRPRLGGLHHPQYVLSRKRVRVLTLLPLVYFQSPLVQLWIVLLVACPLFYPGVKIVCRLAVRWVNVQTLRQCVSSVWNSRYAHAMCLTNNRAVRSKRCWAVLGGAILAFDWGLAVYDNWGWPLVLRR